MRTGDRDGEYFAAGFILFLEFWAFLAIAISALPDLSAAHSLL